MKILVASNMYPGRDPKCDYKGIFVKEQVDSLRLSGEFEVDVYVIDGQKGMLSYVAGSFVLLFKALFGRYDLIHCHYGLSAIFTLLTPFKMWNKVILTLHGGDILIDQGKSFQVAITKRILSKVGFVITLSEEMNNVVSKYTDRYETLVCGADGELFHGKYKLSEKTTFLFPGNPEREVKNYSFFQQVVKAYNRGGERAEVIVLDGFDREQMAEVLSNGSLLLMTSHSEGSPQVIKEAMLSDLPILSSNVGDVAKVVGSTEGTLVYDNSATADEVSRKIDDLLLCAKLKPGIRRKRIFEIELDQKSVIEKLSAIYLRQNQHVK
jgi:teichuronic acid biosynthesis glycosyltransferase TuaC